MPVHMPARRPVFHHLSTFSAFSFVFCATFITSFGFIRFIPGPEPKNSLDHCVNAVLIERELKYRNKRYSLFTKSFYLIRQCLLYYLFNSIFIERVLLCTLHSMLYTPPAFSLYFSKMDF